MSLDQMAVYDAAGIESDNTGQLGSIPRDTSLPIRRVMSLLKELENKGYLQRNGDRWIKIMETAEG